VSARNIDLKDVQERRRDEIELMAAELAGSRDGGRVDSPERFLASGKARVNMVPKAGWQGRFLASGKTPAPRR
jgi:hypothetical protein